MGGRTRAMSVCQQEGDDEMPIARKRGIMVYWRCYASDRDATGHELEHYARQVMG